jgi:diguanylate cyclase (GGDEF)-like protein
VAERLREAVEDAILITNTGTLKFTLSVGIAEVDRNAPDLDTLMKHADAALYSAKDKGRNRVEAFSQRRQ